MRTAATVRFLLDQFLPRGPRPIDEERVVFWDLPLEEWGLVGLYVVFAAVWSRVSGTFLDWLESDPIDTPELQALSALNFILTTGVLLYVVLRRSYRYRRQAREASRLSRERFESVARATTDAIWDWDLGTNTVWWSDGFRKLFGWPEEGMAPGMEAWWARLHPEDRVRVEGGIQAVTNGTGAEWSGSYRLRRSDGSYAEIHDRTHVLRDPAGRPVRVVGGLSDVTAKLRAEQALERSHRQLRALAARLATAREDERTRIAREIHDELGQVLTAVQIDLDWLERRVGVRSGDPESAPVLERIVQAAEAAESALAAVRRIAGELRPRALDVLGLAGAIEQEARRFRERTGLAVEVNVAEEDPGLPAPAAIAVFRILQEALTNVARHAGARSVVVRFTVGPDEVRLVVEDDGAGFDAEAAAARGSLGLLGMRERAESVGGELGIRRGAGEVGTRVELRVGRGAGAGESAGGAEAERRVA